MATGVPTLNIVAERAAVDDRAAVHAGGGSSAALHLLAPVAAFALLAGALLAVLGPSEGMETGLWALAFAVALPLGVAVAVRQVRAMAAAPPGTGAWAVALGTLVIAAAMLLRERTGAGHAQHAAIALAGLVALWIPFGLARESRLRTRLAAAPVGTGPLAAAAALALLASPFIPTAVVTPARLAPALLVAGTVFAVVLATQDSASRPLARRLFDVLAVGLLALVVLMTPDVTLGGYNVIHHHDFFLGPANDVLNGRTMLVDTFSQYGVGVIYALALAFQIVPVGYGGLALVIACATVAVYALTYVTLRAAIDSPMLVACGMAFAVLSNIFLQRESYLFFPSTGPLRFGLPYVLIASAVLAARFPNRSRALRIVGLATLAAAAVWSLETFVYTGAVYAAIVLLEAYGRPAVDLRAGLGIVVRRGVEGLGVVVGAIAAMSLATLVLSGKAPNWGGYLDYIALYSTEGLGQLPVDWFSTGPVAGLAIFLSAAGVVWLSRTGRAPAALLVALAGFTAFAVASFTYYLGRSHPNNLLHLMVPIVALGTLWASVLLRPAAAGGSRPAMLAGAALLAIGASIAVATLPLAKARWPETALSQVVSYVRGDPPGTGLRSSLAREWDQPVVDGRSEEAARLLARLQPGDGPLLVLTEPELTTEILLRAGRRNVLPIANPTEDDLVASSDARVRAALRRVRSGTLMLTSDPQPRGSKTALGAPRDFNGLQQLALDGLRRRFAWRTVTVTPGGLRVVRLVER